MEAEAYFYTVDFRDVRTYMDVHERLYEGLKLPEYYGANLDALWDCLTDLLGGHVHIDIMHYDDFEKTHNDGAKEVLQVFRDFKHCYGNAFYNQITIRVFRGDAVEELT